MSRYCRRFPDRHGTILCGLRHSRWSSDVYVLLDRSQSSAQRVGVRPTQMPHTPRRVRADSFRRPLRSAVQSARATRRCWVTLCGSNRAGIHAVRRPARASASPPAPMGHTRRTASRTDRRRVPARRRGRATMPNSTYMPSRPRPSKPEIKRARAVTPALRVVPVSRSCVLLC